MCYHFISFVSPFPFITEHRMHFVAAILIFTVFSAHPAQLVEFCLLFSITDKVSPTRMGGGGSNRFDFLLYQLQGHFSLKKNDGHAKMFMQKCSSKSMNRTCVPMSSYLWKWWKNHIKTHYSGSFCSTETPKQWVFT